LESNGVKTPEMINPEISHKIHGSWPKVTWRDEEKPHQNLRVSVLFIEEDADAEP